MRALLPAVLSTLLCVGSAAAAPAAVLAATYAVPTQPTAVVAGGALQIPVSLTNTGDEPWLVTGASPVNLTYHWYDAVGTVIVWDGARTPLGTDPVAPQGKRDVTATVVAPAQPGQYALRFALVKEGTAWFT